MSKESIFSSIGDAVSSAATTIDLHAPEIGFWAGLGCIVVGTGIAIYQSLKRVPEIKQEYELDKKELTLREITTNMTEEEVSKEKGKIVRRAVGNYIKAYALPAGLYIAGITFEVGGFIEGQNRYNVLAADFVVTNAALMHERKAVAKLIGEEQEQALYEGKEIEAVTSKIKDENGKTQTVVEYKVKEGSEGDGRVDPYTYYFSPDTSDFCEPNDDAHEQNLRMLHDLEREWTKILNYDKPGMPKTKVVWWVDLLRILGMENEIRLCSRDIGWLNPKLYKTPGDGEIRLRITPERYIAWDGKERWRYKLNPNCDGNVYAIMKSQQNMMDLIGTALE